MPKTELDAASVAYLAPTMRTKGGKPPKPPKGRQLHAHQLGRTLKATRGRP